MIKMAKYGVGYIICKDGDVERDIIQYDDYAGLLKIVSLQTKLEVIAITVGLYNRLYDDNLVLYKISYSRFPVGKSR